MVTVSDGGRRRSRHALVSLRFPFDVVVVVMIICGVVVVIWELRGDQWWWRSVGGLSCGRGGVEIGREAG
ncbi:putative extensin [Iris pallida]|uniref:Extensin n=1 Tax=Iris pallida TaxID=29817 RepID=A0AAX6F618_IRIPA|nr:putative extensin [Iris pallida]KAJ6811649.1 putative extensin [Iris pallida]